MQVAILSLQQEQADQWNAPIVEAPKGRRDEFVDLYFKAAKPDQR